MCAFFIPGSFFAFPYRFGGPKNPKIVIGKRPGIAVNAPGCRLDLRAAAPCTVHPAQNTVQDAGLIGRSGSVGRPAFFFSQNATKTRGGAA